MLELVNDYLNNSPIMAEIIDAYIRIRKELKRLGHTEKSIEKVTKVTLELFKAQDLFYSNQIRLRRKIEEIFNVDETVVNELIQDRLTKINELIPLNNGSKKRNHRRD